MLVVPQARIAHRRARYEGVRTRGGEEVDEETPINPAMSILVAKQRYYYTDIYTIALAGGLGTLPVRGVLQNPDPTGQKTTV